MKQKSQQAVCQHNTPPAPLMFKWGRLPGWLKLYGKAVPIIFLILFSSKSLFSQGNCSTAISISPDSTINYYISGTEMWFKFIATGTEINIGVNPSSNNPNSDISTIELFSGACNNLQSKKIVHGIHFISLKESNLSIGNAYYIRIARNSTAGYFLLSLKESTIVVFNDDECPPECNNLVFNNGFETYFLPIFSTTTAYGTPTNIEDNWLWINPFGTTIDVNRHASIFQDTYENMVCHWKVAKGSPQIKKDNQNNTYAYLQGNNQNHEALYTNIYLKQNVPYTINFKYNLKISPTGTAQANFGFSPYQVIDGSNLNSLNNEFLLPKMTATTGSGLISYATSTYTYIPGKDMYSLIIFPDIVGGNTTELLIDRIEVIPPAPSQKPIGIVQPAYICASSSNVTLTITNYDPVYIYSYTVNNGPVQIAHGPTINISTVGLSGLVTIKVRNYCDNETEFFFSIGCSPDPNTDYEFDDGSIIISPTTFNNNKIHVCGEVNIGADITFENCELNFTTMSRFKVLPGYTLTFDNSLLQDACNYAWDGIYAEDPTSKIIVQNNCTVKHAVNAIVSANGAPVDIQNSLFTDNHTGILIRQYNPECKLVRYPTPPPPPPPPHPAYIAGNTFNNLTFFGGIFPPYSGIVVDTVYNVTIGDYTLPPSAGRNTFTDLTYGIKAIYSQLEIYNNRFENIGKSYLNVDVNNRPLEGAIHASRVILPVGSPISADFSGCISHQLTVGGTTYYQANEFENCNFGVYAYKYLVKCINNNFDHQQYNAIFVDEGGHGCVVNRNNIRMEDGVWANNKLNNVSILLLSGMKPLFGISTDIIGNKIENTRTGIYVLNHSSNPQGVCTRCTKIGSNLIYFDNTLITDGSKKYYGIEVLNCDFSRVAGNHIENRASAYSTGGNVFYPPTNTEVLTGINVAQCKDAWIYDNHQIVKMGRGIRAVGLCTNTQFSCNDLISCHYGIYFHPNETIAATYISQQGWPQRASDNYWQFNFQDRVGGQLNMSSAINWYFRGDDITPNPYNIDVTGKPINQYIVPQPNSNAKSYCVGLPMPEIGEDPNGEYREQRFGDIVREEIQFDVLEEEFEQMSEDYLYEILYANPDIMNIGTPEDSVYQRFFSYYSNETIAEFTGIRGLMDEGNIAQALIDNGKVVAITMIDGNKQLTNEIYLNSVAVDMEIENTYYRPALFTIAMLTPYIGGDGVYTARAMLGIDPDDYGIAYRKAKPESPKAIIDGKIKTYPNPTKDAVTFELNGTEFTTFGELTVYNAMGLMVEKQKIDGKMLFSIPLNGLKPGVYYYIYKDNNGGFDKGKIVKY